MWTRIARRSNGWWLTISISPVRSTTGLTGLLTCGSAGRTGEAMKAFEVVHAVGKASAPLLVYEAETTSGNRFRNCEVHLVRGGRLVATEVLVGAQWLRIHRPFTSACRKTETSIASRDPWPSRGELRHGRRVGRVRARQGARVPEGQSGARRQTRAARPRYARSEPAVDRGGTASRPRPSTRATARANRSRDVHGRYARATS